MRTFQLNKLVRDNIPDTIKAQGQIPVVRTLEGNELDLARREKVREEAAEFAESGEPKELADLLEALGVRAVDSIAGSDVQQLQDARRVEMGGFDKGLYVETVSLPDDNEWMQYYLDNPDRFPEVKQKIKD
ncbi:nucleoside triphosphate pyrophosphohydrolase [Candidatus Saccharibacteria bacterium]|nr:nucleoside triphosphate pyrophosphohydrolase [Candidatus Saccharibacteria bacterium]